MGLIDKFEKWLHGTAIYRLTHSKSNPKTNDYEKEYSFVWYKKMESNGKVYYTKPFRTKVKGKNFKEAKEKAIEFALGKMQLVICEERHYSKTDLSNLENEFDEMSKKMNHIFNKYK